jgi:hypothetical protein
MTVQNATGSELTRRLGQSRERVILSCRFDGPPMPGSWKPPSATPPQPSNQRFRSNDHLGHAKKRVARCATYGSGTAVVFKTANQLQNATIRARDADSSRCLRTADETSRESPFAVAFRWRRLLACAFKKPNHRGLPSHCARNAYRRYAKLAAIWLRKRGRKIAGA